MGNATTPELFVPDYNSKPVTRLRNPVVNAISLVNKGANKKRFFLFKSEDSPVDYDDGHLYIDEAGSVAPDPNDIDKVLPLLKAGPSDDEWKVVYCVVAIPGDIDAQKDVWEEDDIRDSAHNYLKKSRLINFMHKDFDAVGDLVESAVAPVDMEVGGETIPKGTWFIAIEPYPEMKKMISSGDITGVSVQGSSRREPLSTNSTLMPDMAKSGYVNETAVVPRPVTQVDYEAPEYKDDMDIPPNTGGPGIVSLQHILGLPETGKYDANTERAVRQWMKRRGVPGKPVLATIKLILAEGSSSVESPQPPAFTGEEPQAPAPTQQPQEVQEAAGGPEAGPGAGLGQEEALKMFKSKGSIYHYDGDTSKTPLWLKEANKDTVVVEFPPNGEGEAETAEVSLSEIYKCKNPETHYEALVKDHPKYPASFGGEAFNPLDVSTRNQGNAFSRSSSGFGTSSYGSHPENLGTQPSDVGPDSSDDELKAVVIRALSNGNEILTKHLVDSYNINSAQDLYNYPFSKDELWGMVSRFILGRMDKKPSESMYDQPVRRSDKSLYEEGSGFSMQKGAMFDYHRPTDQLPDKNGEMILAGAIVKISGGKLAQVSCVDVNAEEISVEVLPKSGDQKTKIVKAKSVEVVQGDPAVELMGAVADAESLSKGVAARRGGSMGGHDPRKHGKIRFIVRSFGKWAKGKHRVCVRRMRSEHPEVFKGNENAGCAWLKDQWAGTTKWRGKGKKDRLGKLIKGDSVFATSYNEDILLKEFEDPNVVDSLFKAMCADMGLDHVEMEKMCGQEHDILEKDLDNLFGRDESVNDDIEDEDREVAAQFMDIMKTESALEDKLLAVEELLRNSTEAETEEGRQVNNEDFMSAMLALNLGIAEAVANEDLEKREQDLDAVMIDFNRWLNNYVDSGFYFNDGDLMQKFYNHSVFNTTNNEEAVQELLNDKPKGIEVAEDMEKAGDLKGATVEDSEGRRGIVVGHDGDELSVRIGKENVMMSASDVKVVREPMGKGGMSYDEEGMEMPKKKRRMRLPMPSKDEAEDAGMEKMPEAGGMEYGDGGMEMPKKKKKRLMPGGMMEKMPEADGMEMPKKKKRPMPPMEAPEGEAPDDVARVPEAPEAPEAPKAPKAADASDRLGRLLALARKRKKAVAGDAPEEQAVEKSASPLTAAKIERLRETKEFLDNILNSPVDEEVVEDTEPDYEAPEMVAEEEDTDFVQTENTDVEKDVDTSETEDMEVEMSDDITMDQVVEAINGLGEEVDGILENIGELSALGGKLDHIGDLAKSLDGTERLDVIEQAVGRLTEALGAFVDTAESVEEISKRLTALEDQPGSSTAAPVDSVHAIAKSAPEQPELFQRSWGSIF